MCPIFVVSLIIFFGRSDDDTIATVYSSKYVSVLMKQWFHAQLEQKVLNGIYYFYLNILKKTCLFAVKFHVRFK